MLDFFTIFSKGGILLFCFKGFDLDKKAWESFVHTVNSLNKTVFLQDKSDRKNIFEQGSLALKYKLDNEFELVFVVGYQKSLPLNYLDKLLDEIQLRFRDKYAQDLKEFNFQSNFNDFSGEFETTRALVEKKCKEIQDSKQMGTFKESAKSSKTVASMIIDKNSNATTTSTKKSTAQEIKTDDKAADGDDALDEETIRINRERMAAGKKKVPGPYKPKTPKAVKSPKPEKASKSGKPGTKWDPFMFNGKGPSEREAKELDRTVKSGTEDDAQLDPQLNQFVPDISRVNQSAEQCDGQTLARFRGSVPLVYSRGSSMYFDKDGDLADEFYEEVMPKKGKSRRKMRKINSKFLIPQGDVPYQSPRIHVDFPVILHQV